MKKNRKGGIEGLPLQLMIIIMVATLGTAIIVGWMGNIETPHSISDVDFVNDNVVAKNGATMEKITCYVYDQDGNPVEGATVALSGLGVKSGTNKSVFTTTDADGCASFNNGLKVNLSGTVGYLTVEVSSPEYGGYTCNLPVVKG